MKRRQSLAPLFSQTGRLVRTRNGSGVPIDHEVPGQEAEQQQLQHIETLGAEALRNPSIDRVHVDAEVESAYRQLKSARAQ